MPKLGGSSPTPKPDPLEDYGDSLIAKVKDNASKEAPPVHMGPDQSESRPRKPAPPNSWFTELTDEKEFTKALFYGREGTGKTTAATRAAEGGRVLVVNSEGGLKRTALKQQGVDVSQVAVWPPEGTEITARSLEALHEKILGDLHDDPSSWYAVVIDSLTEIHHLLRENATSERVRKSRTEVDPDFVDRDDYGKMTAQLRKLIRRFRDLPCHVVVIALEKDDETNNEIRPSLTPALNTDVLGYMDVVVRFGSPDGSFRGRMKGTSRIRAKDRFGILPEVLAEPSFPRLQGILEGTLDLDADPVQSEFTKATAEAAKAAAESEKKPVAKKTTRARKTAAAPAASATPSKEDTSNA